jgi:cytidine deaminase
MHRFNLIISVTEYSSTDELDGQYKELVKSAYEACSTSYAPFSKFCAGAAVLLENGKIIKGSNQENAAYPSGLCAERVAVFYANSRYPEIPVTAIAIASSVAGIPCKEPVYPCGSCRQSLLQSEQRFQKDIRIFMVGSEKILMVESVRDLLPLVFNFSPEP